MLAVLAAGAIGVRAQAVPNYTKKADGVAEAAKLEPAVALYEQCGFRLLPAGVVCALGQKTEAKQA